MRPHAVTGTSGGAFRPATSYAYDANGAMTSGNGATTTWTAFGKVLTMAKGTTSLSWAYDPDHHRAKQSSTVAGSTTDTYDFADAASGAEFVAESGGLNSFNDYIFADGGMIGLHVRKSDASEHLRYFVKDHLGSTAVLVDHMGAVAERLAYDPWGKRRHPNGADDVANTLTAQTTRGFTGHEMIDEVDLVNMNGRVYDPTLGRFLSADPFIHDVTNSQDLNRYSYVHNNPLSFTDMNGYGFFKSIGKFFKKFWKPLLAIIAAIVAIHLGPLLFGEAAGTALVGAESTLTFGQSAIISGISGGLSIGAETGPLIGVEKGPPYCDP